MAEQSKRLIRLATAAVIFSAMVVHPALAAPPQTPNIVFIVADDECWRDYSFMGHPHIRTPNIDTLASQSLVFRNAYVTSSLCRASLAAMLSGLYPHQHRITSNEAAWPKGVPAREVGLHPTFREESRRMIDFVDRVPMLPRTLGAHGYKSFQTGKWWEGDFSRGGFTDGMSRGGHHGDKGLDIGRVTMQPIYDFIDRATAAGDPFLVWYAPMLPHSPHDPPERLLKHYESVAPSDQIAKYWAMCEWLDETCGQLLGYLDSKQLREKTLVIFLADNGWIQRADSAGPAARSKASPYNGGLRTPLLLSMPGRIAPDECPSMAISIDLAPTILSFVGLKPTDQMQGINLLDPAARANRHTIFGECFNVNAVDLNRPATSLKWRWCIDDNWKLILPHAPNLPAAAELYDLQADPDETKNLANEQPAKVSSLERLLDAWWSPER
ncbi:MAG TPA: sulfatase-like hydrolase/transferase [Pirellulales bacterium]|jgi:uncharacterized sulfatase|nr:sulfatase-like hydrolase/transferase [Pirellulales bacterium]